MPVSSEINKQWIADRFNDHVPHGGIILDVGAGCGTYSNLLRKTDQKWIAIEAFERYVSDYSLNEKYDQVVIGDIRKIFLKHHFDSVDAIILGDVLEHMSEAEAYQVVRGCLEVSKIIFISAPVGRVPQGAAFGNEFERHRHDWNHDRFVKTFCDFNVTIECNLEFDQRLNITMGAYFVRL